MTFASTEQRRRVMRNGRPLHASILGAIVSLVAFGVSSFAGEVDELAAYAETDSDKAVDKALDFLAKTQKPEGCWDTPGFGRCTSVTALSVMAFLARGHVPGRGRYGRTVERGIAYLLQCQRDDGYVVQQNGYNSMYAHGSSTLCLGEVLGMVGPQPPAPPAPPAKPGQPAQPPPPPKDLVQAPLDPAQIRAIGELEPKFSKAVEMTLKSQAVPKDPNSAGGWRYNPSSNDSDLSCTGWQVLSLRAARNDGYPVPKSAIDSAVAYVSRCASKDGGFAYQPGGDSGLARTGTGVVALMICGEHKSERAAAAADWLLKHPPKWEGEFFYYSMYHCTQACYQLGGKNWEAWKPALEKVLVPQQKPDGSWPFPPGNSHECNAGPAYGTAISVLALSVEYCYLPIYQR